MAEFDDVAANSVPVLDPLFLKGVGTAFGLMLTGAAVTLGVAGLGAALPGKLLAGLSIRGRGGTRAAHARRLLGRGLR